MGGSSLEEEDLKVAFDECVVVSASRRHENVHPALLGG